MGRQGKVTDEMRGRILEDVRRGISYRQIAPRYRVTETTIRRIVHARDVAPGWAFWSAVIECASPTEGGPNS